MYAERGPWPSVVLEDGEPAAEELGDPVAGNFGEVAVEELEALPSEGDSDAGPAPPLVWPDGVVENV